MADALLDDLRAVIAKRQAVVGAPYARGCTTH